METQHSGRSSFSGKLGFVLSAAGASVGLGNIWRFPYLAAKYGGGIFLLIYILLAVTFGYTMIMAETALGRMTRKSPVGAFAASGKGRWRAFGGWINAVIPILIVPYYSVIGGWVIKYLVGYITGHGSELAQDGYFSSFIANGASVEIVFLLFTLLTLGIIFAGVRNGVERVSRMMMPVLVVLSVIIAGKGAISIEESISDVSELGGDYFSDDELMKEYIESQIGWSEGDYGIMNISVEADPQMMTLGSEYYRGDGGILCRAPRGGGGSRRPAPEASCPRWSRS